MSPFRSQLGFFDECETKFRAWPSDIDLNIHINNGKYLSMMDLGRFDLIFRTRAIKRLKAHSVFPVVSSQSIRYQKSIGLFQSFSIKTKVLGWDDKFFFLQQTFESKGEPVALAIVKARFLKKGVKNFTTHDVVKIIDDSVSSPPIPNWVTLWVDSEKESWSAVEA